MTQTAAGGVSGISLKAAFDRDDPRDRTQGQGGVFCSVPEFRQRQTGHDVQHGDRYVGISEVS